MRVLGAVGWTGSLVQVLGNAYRHGDHRGGAVVGQQTGWHGLYVWVSLFAVESLCPCLTPPPHSDNGLGFYLSPVVGLLQAQGRVECSRQLQGVLPALVESLCGH